MPLRTIFLLTFSVYYSMIEIVKLVYKWKKHILLFCLFAVIVSIILTMPSIMPPYYKSKMIFYLSNPVSTDRAALFNEKEAGGVYPFGGKEEINRFLTILTSDPAITHIIDKYNLGKHYDIEKDESGLYRYYTALEFNSNFDAIRNDNGALEVTFMDRDNKLAAAVVKDIVQYADSVYRNMLLVNKTNVLTLLDEQIALKKANGSDAEELKKFITIRDQYTVASSNTFKTMYIVENPTPAIKKCKPIRWLIVLSTLIGSFILACFTALIIELYKNADRFGFQRD